MVFSSLTFFYFFLPVVLIVYMAASKKLKNLILLIAGLIFYAWGEPVYIWVMIASSLVDYAAGLYMSKSDKQSSRRLALVISMVVDLGFLFVFKYSGFVVNVINTCFKTSITEPDLPLPIGISFYTFQSMSYTIDIYLKKVKVQKNFINYLTYVSLFPQLVAGPIVRYDEVAEEIDDRKINADNVGEGAGLFIKGLAKKVLLANNIGMLWTQIKAMDYSELSVLSAWLGILAFTFQIYFDFSGYSDMARGLGKIFGFNFPVNFDHPYQSKSISEFWRRWHITLGSWFRTYVYIPHPHFHFSAVLFTFAEMKKLELYTSPLIIANTFYILRKQIGNDSAKNAIRKLRILLHVIDSSESVIDKALNSDFSDFEDAVQYYTALEHEIPVILTRNIRNYKKTSVIVQTPETFLVMKQLI